MSKHKHSRTNSHGKRNQNDYLIKMPLFIIPLKKEDKGLFGALSKNDMVNNLIAELNKFPVTELPSRGKTRRTVISSIKPTLVTINDSPAILVQASVFETNLDDTYLKMSPTDKSKLPKTSQIGSEQYYILFYPRIEGQHSDKYIYTWLQVVLEDPAHSTGIATAVAKKLVRSLLAAEPFNVKLQSAIDEMKGIEYCPELNIELTTVSHSDDEEFPTLTKYHQSTTIRTISKHTFQNVPTDKVAEVLRESPDKCFISVTKKAIFGKKEYRVKRQRYEEASELKESVDLLFNSTFSATQNDVESGKIFSSDFLLERDRKSVV